jgi:hypothetical protein
MCKVVEPCVLVEGVWLKGDRKGLVKTYRWSLEELNEDPMWPEGVGAMFGNVGLTLLSITVNGMLRPHLESRALQAQRRYEASVNA